MGTEAATSQPATASNPSERDVWQANSGQLAWPTIVLSLSAASAHVTVFVLHAVGWLGDLGAVSLAFVLAYVAFTPLHEASHGNVAGRVRAGGAAQKIIARFDAAVGWLSGIQLLAPFPAFKVLHLQHHSHTNDTRKDPDMWVAAHGTHSWVRAFSVLAKCFTLLPYYYADFFVGPASETKAARTQRVPVIVGVFVLLAIITTFAGFGLGRTVFFAWILPAWFATALLGLLFDWLPHRPHDTRGRYLDTRAIDAPLGVPMLGQHLHLVHHLYPRVPFYRYRRVFDALRPLLLRKGARIDRGGASRHGLKGH